MKKRNGLLAAFLALALVAGAACGKKSPTSPDDGSSGLEFSGTITQGGTAMAGVTVYLSWGASQSVVTGSDGKFSFTGLASGSYIVTPVRAGSRFEPRNYEVALTRKDLNFAASAANYGTQVGNIAKDFTAKNQGGSSVSLASYLGKVVLIDFTANWCVPCREKAQTANAFYNQYKDRGFIYILIVIEGSPASWAAEYGLTFPVLDDNSRTIYNQWRTSGSIPLPHVLDRNHNIQYKKEGGSKEEYEALIKKYL